MFRSATQFCAQKIASLLLRYDLMIVWEALIYYDRSILFTCKNSSARLTLAFVSAEDHRFFRHMGVDWLGISTAIGRYLLTGKVCGASTIEQQLVRVLRGRYEFTIRRKLGEILLALTLYGIIDKERIVEIYSYVAYYGAHGNGIMEICERLGFDSNDLSLDQAIQIAALLNRPLPSEPSPAYAEALSRRVAYVRDRLAKLIGTGKEINALMERAHLGHLPTGNGV